MEPFQTFQVLKEIDKFLQKLDDISYHREKIFCSSPSYGHLIVVINKMTKNTTDQDLSYDLMTQEADIGTDSRERNEIREKMKQCFDGISVHGLPDVGEHDVEGVDYPILDERFRTALASIANTILEQAPTPWNVSVGGLELELNSTSAEVIISTLIDEANETD